MPSNKRPDTNDQETIFDYPNAGPQRPRAPGWEPEPLDSASIRLPVSSEQSAISINSQELQGRIEIAAASLLGLIARIKLIARPPNQEQLIKEAIESVDKFESIIGRDFNFNDKMAKDASYLVCATIDDLVVNETSWGKSGIFHAKGVCSSVHPSQKGWWGEVFFDLVKTFKSNTSLYHNHLELAFLCLSLGFQGKYRRNVSEQVVRGRSEFSNVEEERNDIWRTIKSNYDAIGFDNRFNLHIQSATKESVAPPRRPFPLWVYFSVALLILMMIGISQLNYNGELSDLSSNYLNTPIISYPERIHTMPRANHPIYLILIERLNQDIDNGQIEVINEAGNAMIRIPGSTLFDSGIADIRAEHISSLQRIALALKKMENGTIRVDGYADSNSLGKGGPFKSNQELSEARAMRVKDKLLEYMGDATNRTIKSVGRGANNFLPGINNNDPRQRRVEITVYPSGEQP